MADAEPKGEMTYQVTTTTGTRTVSREEFLRMSGLEGGSIITPEPRDLLVDVIKEERNKSQAFFAELAAETRKPHYGEMQSGWVKALLVRAQERGLYKPEDA
jgi:hypothetical protein